MIREQEFLKVKDIIKENIDDARCGIFNTRNLVGDSMTTIFSGEYFTVDICYGWAYFEIFGTTKEEFKELEDLYEKLCEEVEEND